jgi:drug/metabolite transporter (DMT)-like permease
MDRTVAAVAAVVMSAVGIAGDYFLKQASGRSRPLATGAFLAGLVLYASTAFAWVFVMRHLKLATIGVIYSVSMVLLLAGMGVLFFGESLSGREVGGILLAIAALCLLARGD